MSDDDARSESKPLPRARPRWRTQPVGRGLVPTAGLCLAFALLTWLVQRPGGQSLDVWLDRNYHIQHIAFLLHDADRIGQRAVCLPVLAVVVAVLAWRHRSMRPVLLAVVAVLSINFVVLILKVWLGRGAPLEHRPEFWIGGQMFPSGHTANVIVVYGTCVYLIRHYGMASVRVFRALVLVVVFLGCVMICTSLTLHWHWFTDLIAGYLVGGAVLTMTIAVDGAVPFRSRRLVVAPPPSLPVDTADDRPQPLPQAPSEPPTVRPVSSSDS
ncbi:MAG: phosphatase PAP2 family protein [Nocardioidaceae bacterium]